MEVFPQVAMSPQEHLVPFSMHASYVHADVASCLEVLGAPSPQLPYFIQASTPEVCILLKYPSLPPQTHLEELHDFSPPAPLCSECLYIAMVLVRISPTIKGFPLGHSWAAAGARFIAHGVGSGWLLHVWGLVVVL